MKVFLFLVLILISILHYKKRQIQTIPWISSVQPLEVDILLSPGGFKGIYMIGICHYVKNHFPVRDKSIAGFSCGSFNALFMRLNPRLDHVFLRHMFAMDKNASIHKILTDTVHTVRDHFVYEDFDLRQTHIGVTTLKGIELYRDFSCMSDLLACCKSSSFIPFVTQREGLLFYKNKMTFDGGVYYKRIKKNKKKETLLITSSMFGRYMEHLLIGLRRPKCSYYQLYLNGYRDAQKHHAFFEPYFIHTPLS